MVLLPAALLLTHSSASAQENVLSSPQPHRPMIFHGLRPDESTDSENWAGYAVTGADFKQVTGSWIVPEVNCSQTPNTYSATWVGIDGYSSSTVEQTGTESDCNGQLPSYYAWYEFYPRPPIPISTLTVSPGDTMSAEVSYNGGEFTITITDVTTGVSYNKSAKVAAAKRSSAEWIVEAPCCTAKGYSRPLADFGTVSLGLDYTGLSGTNAAADSSSGGSIPISGFSTVQAITLVTAKGIDEAQPAPLTADGSSFTVTWKSK
jgi:hypothetical protein